MAQYKAFMKRAEIMQLMTLARIGENEELLSIISRQLVRAKKEKRPGYVQVFGKLEHWLEADNTPPPFSVFVEGNGKLPFLQFANAPVVNCPGAGDCLSFCYSLGSWRHINAVGRQLMNTVLMQTAAGRKVISWEFAKALDTKKLRKLERVDFRLYVDGDFASTDEIKFWLELLKKFPRVRSYGYSKSVHLFLELEKQGYDWPKIGSEYLYTLNLSSGGKFDGAGYWQQLEKLPFVRGRFIAVQLDGLRSGKARSKQDRADIYAAVGKPAAYKERTGRRLFICPGQCGSCTTAGHACGNGDKFKNVDVLIPVH